MRAPTPKVEATTAPAPEKKLEKGPQPKPTKRNKSNGKQPQQVASR
jgi:hypothetical protein